MSQIGMITEGVTDQDVIRHIMNKIAGDGIRFMPLQPESSEEGGWNKVFRYLASERIHFALSTLDYVVIQIDSDVSFEPGFDVPHREHGVDLEPHQLLERVRDRLIERMGKDLFTQHQNKILFAIAVHSTECWFLPYYFESVPAKRSKRANCLTTLNDALNSQEGFSIDPKAKNVNGYYHTISRKAFSKRKDIEAAAKHQRSLQHFLDQITPLAHNA